jgi:hypothetical protein
MRLVSKLRQKLVTEGGEPSVTIFFYSIGLNQKFKVID